MTILAAFSTDWSQEKVPDEAQTALTGRQSYKEGQSLLTFGGTYFYRCAMPAMELAKHGYTSILSYQLDVATDGHFRAMDTAGDWHDPDILWMQRWMQQGGPDHIRRARSTGQQIIQDCDDDFWSLPKTNIAIDSTDPIKNPTFNRDHYLDIIAASSAITVSTDALRRRLERLGPPVHVVRNAIDLERWSVHDPGADGAIGWVGGIQWRAHDLQILRPVLPDFLSDYGLPFFHGGDSQVAGVPKAYEQIGIDPTVIQCLTSPLVHISQYPSLWETINLALIPLERCRFNEAKSYLKSLEASACGLPYIVSAGLPEQHILIDEGGAGREAKNERPQSWRDHLEDLLDPDVRRSEGRRNRAVAELHDIRHRWVDWHNVFSEYLDTPLVPATTIDAP